MKVVNGRNAKRVLLRPLGNVITICPPLNIEHEGLEEIAHALADSLKLLG